MKPLSATLPPPTRREAACPTHGAYQATALTVAGRRVVGPCPHCRQARQAAEAAHDAKVRDFAAARAKRAAAARLAAMVQRSAVPTRFAEKGFEDFDFTAPSAPAARQAQAFADAFAAGKDDGQGLILAGGIGLGKTHLACATLNRAMRAGRTALYLTASEAIARIQDGYGDGTRTKKMRALCDVDLLALDEVGRHKQTDDAAAILGELIDQRYLAMRSTILITNLDIEALKETLGAAASDRLREGRVMVAVFEGESWRGRADG